MGKVVELSTITTLPIDPVKVLNAAISRGLEDVIVIGREKGGEAYYAASHSHVPTIIWDLRLFEHAMIEKYKE